MKKLQRLQETCICNVRGSLGNAIPTCFRGFIHCRFRFLKTASKSMKPDSILSHVLLWVKFSPSS